MTGGDGLRVEPLTIIGDGQAKGRGMQVQRHDNVLGLGMLDRIGQRLINDAIEFPLFGLAQPSFHIQAHLYRHPLALLQRTGQVGQRLKKGLPCQSRGAQVSNERAQIIGRLMHGTPGLGQGAPRPFRVGAQQHVCRAQLQLHAEKRLADRVMQFAGDALPLLQTGLSGRHLGQLGL